MDLFGAELVAIDGSKFKASNSKQHLWTKAKLRERIQQIDTTIDEYLKLLETNDQQETVRPIKVQEKIASLQHRMKQYRTLLEQLESTNTNQVALTDPDCRMMIGNGKTNAAYNIQTAVDSKYKLIVAYEVTNDINDRYQLASMAQMAKNSLGVDTLSVVADKGYVTGTELHQCE